MCGNLRAFGNGNSLAGLFGADLFGRLPDEQGGPIRKQGGRDFEPLAGHAMKGYVTVPTTWRTKPAAAKAWIGASLVFARTLPPKALAGKNAAAEKPSARKQPRASGASAYPS